MQDLEIVSEKAKYIRVRKFLRDMVPVQTQDLLALIEHYCEPSLPPPGQERTQFLIGTKHRQYNSHSRGTWAETPLLFGRPLSAPFNVVRLNWAARHKSPVSAGTAFPNNARTLPTGSGGQGASRSGSRCAQE